MRARWGRVKEKKGRNKPPKVKKAGGQRRAKAQYDLGSFPKVVAVSAGAPVEMARGSNVTSLQLFICIATLEPQTPPIIFSNHSREAQDGLVSPIPVSEKRRLGQGQKRS